MQAGKHLGEINLTLTDEHLLPQLVGVGGPPAVFRVRGLHVRAQNLERVDGIRFAVEDEVGRVQPHAKRRMVHILNHPQHGGGRLLAGLHEEALAVRAAVYGQFVNGGDRLRVERILRVFRNEAAVRLHKADAETRSEVGALLERVDARGASGARHDANGGGAFDKVPLQRLRIDHLGCGGHHVVAIQQTCELLCQRRREVAEVAIQRKKAGGEAKPADHCNLLFRIGKGLDQQAERHGLIGTLGL